LYVGDLSSTIPEAQRHDLFSTAGQVVEVDHSQGLPFAVVEMASVQEAQQAIAYFNGYSLAGCRLIVYRMPPRSRPRTS
jgi:RNA recognition motif